MNTTVSVGVDNGGTWIRFRGLDAQGRLRWSTQERSPHLQQLPIVLRRRLSRFGGRLALLAVGSSGMWNRSKSRTLQAALSGLAHKIVVMSDVEAAWLASFSGQKEMRGGIVVIAGTGSIALGRKGRSPMVRAGGLGPEIGDEGSGF